MNNIGLGRFFFFLQHFSLQCYLMLASKSEMLPPLLDRYNTAPVAQLSLALPSQNQYFIKTTIAVCFKSITHPLQPLRSPAFQSLPPDKNNVNTPPSPPQTNYLDFILPHFTSRILRSSLSYCISVNIVTRTDLAEDFIIPTCLAVTVLHLIQGRTRGTIPVPRQLLLSIVLKIFYFPFSLHN